MQADPSPAVETEPEPLQLRGERGGRWLLPGCFFLTRSRRKTRPGRRALPSSPGKTQRHPAEKLQELQGAGPNAEQVRASPSPLCRVVSTGGEDPAVPPSTAATRWSSWAPFLLPTSIQAPQEQTWAGSFQPLLPSGRGESEASIERSSPPRSNTGDRPISTSNGPRLPGGLDQPLQPQCGASKQMENPSPQTSKVLLPAIGSGVTSATA